MVTKILQFKVRHCYYDESDIATLYRTSSEYEAAAINRATGRVDYLGTPPQSIDRAHAHLHCACALPVPTHFVHKLMRNNFYSIMIHTQCHTIL